jgi:hypothetical protein
MEPSEQTPIDLEAIRARVEKIEGRPLEIGPDFDMTAAVMSTEGILSAARGVPAESRLPSHPAPRRTSPPIRRGIGSYRSVPYLSQLRRRIFRGLTLPRAVWDAEYARLGAEQLDPNGDLRADRDARVYENVDSQLRRLAWAAAPDHPPFIAALVNWRPFNWLRPRAVGKVVRTSHPSRRMRLVTRRRLAAMANWRPLEQAALRLWSWCGFAGLDRDLRIDPVLGGHAVMATDVEVARAFPRPTVSPTRPEQPPGLAILAGIQSEADPTLNRSQQLVAILWERGPLALVEPTDRSALPRLVDQQQLISRQPSQFVITPNTETLPMNFWKIIWTIAALLMAYGRLSGRGEPFFAGLIENPPPSLQVEDFFKDAAHGVTFMLLGIWACSWVICRRFRRVQQTGELVSVFGARVALNPSDPVSLWDWWYFWLWTGLTAVEAYAFFARIGR